MQLPTRLQRVHKDDRRWEEAKARAPLLHRYQPPMETVTSAAPKVRNQDFRCVLLLHPFFKYSPGCRR